MKRKYAAMFTLRSDGRYTASYTDSTGRHYLYDKDPEKLYHKLQAATNPVKQVVTFRQCAEAWEAMHREEIHPKSWNNYLPHYKEMLSKHGHRPIEDITAQDVVAHLLSAKNQGYSATVVNTIRSIYRMIMDYAVANDYAKYNPVVSVRLPKGLKRGKRSAPSDEMIQKIFAAADAPFGLFPLLLLCTGLRKSEALALTWDDVDFSNRRIYVTKSLDYVNGSLPKTKLPKTEAGIRTVPIIDILYHHLQQAYRASDSALLFPAPPSNRGGQGGHYMGLRGFEGAWARWCAAAGLVEDGKPVITAHNLRHGTATLMFEMEVDELTAQRVLGHSRIEITREIYTQLREEKARQSLDKFNIGMEKYAKK